MIRNNWCNIIKEGFEVHPIVALLGPRQCGKTTLANQYIQQSGAAKTENYFDLENREHLAKLNNPQLMLSSLSGLIVIDEIQRKPELFQTLRVLIDTRPDQQYLILGSSSRELLKQSSESLAGRIEYAELTPFSLQEINDLKKLWIRGGMPRSYLAEQQQYSYRWREAYIRTFLEQDLAAMGINVEPGNMRRLWNMLAFYHGNIININELSQSLQLSNKTVSRYIDILSSTLLIRQLQPWYENIKKRQVKSPKIFFRDSGLYHTLLTVPDYQTLTNHPKLGASWEGFALEEVIRYFRLRAEDCYFWASHAGAEIDLFFFHNGKRIGIECKFNDKPKTTKSMHSAMESLKLDQIYVVHPGSSHFPLAENITAVSLQNMSSAFQEI